MGNKWFESTIHLVTMNAIGAILLIKTCLIS